MKHLIFLSTLLGAFFVSSTTDAGKIKFKDPVSNFSYDYDAEEKILSITKLTKDQNEDKEEVSGKITNITAVWTHDDAQLTSKVTFTLDKEIFNKEVPALPYQPLGADLDFTSGEVQPDGFQHIWRFDHYKRPDDSNYQRFLEEHFEKKEMITAEKIVQRCIQTKEIFSQGHSKKEHWAQDIKIIDTTEVILRKNRPEDTPYELKRTPLPSREELLAEIKYLGSTTAGQSCPAGGCTGPHADTYIQGALNSVTGALKKLR